MHNLLEEYLAEVTTHLRPMPAKQRNDELREMRQHLLNAVIVNREHGQSKEDAAANAVQQFGMPEDLGENLVWAWRRERSLNRRSLLGAAVCASALLYTMPIVVLMLMVSFVASLTQQLWEDHRGLDAALLSFIAYDLPAYVLIGAMIGRLFPRRAALGTSFAASVWAVIMTQWRLWWEYLVYRPGYLKYAYFYAPSHTAWDIIRTFAFYAAPALIAVVVASVTSRWWMKRMARLRLARD